MANRKIMQVYFNTLSDEPILRYLEGKNLTKLIKPWLLAQIGDKGVEKQIDPALAEYVERLVETKIAGIIAPNIERPAKALDMQTPAIVAEVLSCL